jgi:ATP-dependent DNA helicase RecQ
MPTALAATTNDHTALRDVVKTVWGYEQLLPLQFEAMSCVLFGRDSLVVLPTGGGKSLCFQAPLVSRNGFGVVVSPLIALMKDQVDGLREVGVPAAYLHSGLSNERRQAVMQEVTEGRCRLLYVAPETLVRPQFLDFLRAQRVDLFAVDEAHCISAWGHDFRPEYRELADLRHWFTGVPVHAYTATATAAVQADIARTLGLRQPQVLVGDFFRPNLTYHVAKRARSINQIVSVIERHRGEAGLIYCISRAETESLAAALQQLGYSCAAYHAGLADDERTRRQDAFIQGETEIIVATIAFGMGINKPDVRFVIHAGMPKSLANYQQESGRAGRDGLEAECWLLYSGKDAFLWRRILEGTPPAARAAAEELLQAMHAYCVSTQCRHRKLVEHFGQAWDRGKCQACDVCRGQFEAVDDSLVVGQKIISCVKRVHENFGAGHVAKVLRGSRDQDVMAHGHHELSTYGLLREFRIADIRDWIEQLVGQGCLCRVGEFGVLAVTRQGWRVLRGEVAPVLSRAARQTELSTSAAIVDSWEGVDRELFYRLRSWRRATALSRGVASYLIFSDVSLRDLARRRPSTPDGLRQVHGIGERKLQEFGSELLALIADYCASQHVPTDQAPETVEIAEAHPTLLAAFGLFDAGRSPAEVAQTLSRAESTAHQYLERYIRARGITDPAPWLDEPTLDAIRAVAQYAGLERMRPLFDAFHGRISYHHLRIAAALLYNQGLCVIAD